MNENEFPPILSYMEKQVGKKNELKIAIPKTSKLYYEYTKDDNPYLQNGNRFENEIKSEIDHSIFDSYITNIEKIDDSLVITVNIENIPKQKIKIVEDYNVNNQFIFYYEFGYGYLLNIEIVTCNEFKSLIKTVTKIRYLKKNHKKLLLDMGYNKHLLYNLYDNDKNIVFIDPQVFDGYYNYKLQIYDKFIWINYHKIEKEIENKMIDSQYKILSDIIK